MGDDMHWMGQSGDDGKGADRITGALGFEGGWCFQAKHVRGVHNR